MSSTKYELSGHEALVQILVEEPRWDLDLEALQTVQAMPDLTGAL